MDYADSKNSAFVGKYSFFPLTAYLGSLWAHGRAVAQYARWPLNAIGEILSMDLPINRPGATAAC